MFVNLKTAWNALWLWATAAGLIWVICHRALQVARRRWIRLRTPLLPLSVQLIWRTLSEQLFSVYSNRSKAIGTSGTHAGDKPRDAVSKAQALQHWNGDIGDEPGVAVTVSGRGPDFLPVAIGIFAWCNS